MTKEQLHKGSQIETQIRQTEASRLTIFSVSQMWGKEQWRTCPSLAGVIREDIWEEAVRKWNEAVDTRIEELNKELEEL